MKILVAMSGGVDSAVTALLLKKQGHEVVGCTAKMWQGADPKDILDAQKVCVQLGIEHHSIDLSEEFHKKVILPFVEEYDRGRTPNPCLSCNRCIKFGTLMRYMQDFGCEGFATGHYARIGEEKGEKVLLRAKDVTKDQSYVLYSLTQEQLQHLYLPLGEYTKEEIRAMAGKAGIEVAHKSDSQDICFVPDGDYEKVLNKVGLHHSHAGNFELTDGRKVGKHRGTACYTIGQRKGLGIAWEHPLYVVGKNPATNAVILGKNEELFEKELFAEQLNFINPVVNKFVCTAKIRYKAKDMPCEVEMQDGGAKVQFAEPQRAITPGQGIVFYDGEKILGGGIIK